MYVCTYTRRSLLGVQVCGAFPDTMTKCAEMLCQHVEVDFIDINCGCPIDLIFNSVNSACYMPKVRGVVHLYSLPTRPAHLGCGECLNETDKET